MKSLWSSQNAQAKVFLIVGLGNPGLSYQKTRHNIGFKVVKHFAKKHGLSFREMAQLKGEVAQGSIGGEKVILLMPMTYMNCSGEALIRCINFFKPDPQKIVVVADDVALAFGFLRLRESGGAGGHNGLKNIEHHLKTQSYPRLRIGVGMPTREELADYVLGKFTAEEEKAIPQLAEKATQALEVWIAQGIEAAMNIANTKVS